MGNFDETANLFAIQNIEVQENVGLYGRLLTKENRVDPFGFCIIRSIVCKKNLD